MILATLLPWRKCEVSVKLTFFRTFFLILIEYSNQRFKDGTVKTFGREIVICIGVIKSYSFLLVQI